MRSTCSDLRTPGAIQKVSEVALQFRSGGLTWNTKKRWVEVDLCRFEGAWSDSKSVRSEAPVWVRKFHVERKEEIGLDRRLSF